MYRIFWEYLEELPAQEAAFYECVSADLKCPNFADLECPDFADRQ